jgi:Holliday junction resolvase RusA-like endonuclease
MDGFDQAWLEKHTRTKGVKATIQAGAGSRAPQPLADDPFALIDVSAGVTLVLPYPPSGNHYKQPQIITPTDKEKKPFLHWFLTKEAEAFKAEVQRCALMAGLRHPYPWRVTVHGMLYPNRPQDWEKRARKDPLGWDDDVRCIDVADNCPKVTLDALQGVAYENDKLVWDSRFQRMEPDAYPSRLVVIIKPMLRESPQGALL